MAKQRSGEAAFRSCVRARRAALAALAAGLCLSGCARIVIKTDPPGARILYSDNGLAPWKPWRPEKRKDISPSKTIVWCGTFRFFRAEKEGYYPAPPQLVEAFMFNVEKVHFTLEPSPEIVAQQKRAQGLVFWPPDGTWVNPVEKGLAQHNGEWMTPQEKFAREQKEAGLVEYQGRWVRPEERDQLVAEAQKAAGYVLYKNQWIRAEDQAKQAEVDRMVSECSTTKTMSLPAIGTMPRPMATKTEIKVSNGTRSAIRAYFSGPGSFEMLVEGFSLESREMIPGLYRIAIVPEMPDLPTQTGEATFEDVGAKQLAVVYSLDYQGDPGGLLRKIQSEKPPDLQLPTITIPEVKLPEAPEEEEAAPTEEEQALARELMSRVRAGELTMEEAQKQMPKSVAKQFERRQSERKAGGEGAGGPGVEGGPGPGAGGRGRPQEGGAPGGPGRGEGGARRGPGPEGAGPGAGGAGTGQEPPNPEASPEPAPAATPEE